MGKAGNHSLMDGASGKVGRKAVFRESFGETIIGVRPKKRTSVTPAQLEFRKTFRQAAHYGKFIMDSNPEVKTLYQTGINSKKRSAYLVATSDFMNLPKIEEVRQGTYSGTIGDKFVVIASDDFKIVAVSIAIKDATGKEIERGAAVPYPATLDAWIYTVTAANAVLPGTQIVVSASDVAGNIATKTVTL